MKTAVLISGRGSNMRALVKASQADGFPAEIVRVISNEPAAAGLDFAARAGIETDVVNHRDFNGRESFEDVLHERLVAAEVELVCLAGFMRLLTEHLVFRWSDRILNIHPSLLPSYKGLQTHERVIEDGVRFTGCTVHFVRPAMDSGPIICQAAVPVLQDDTADLLAARVLEAEHRCYPYALSLVAAGKTTIVDEKVAIDGIRQSGNVLVNPPDSPT